MGRIADSLRKMQEELRAAEAAIKAEEDALLANIIKAERRAQRTVDLIDQEGWEA